jgi:hypothetical protein
MCIARNPPFEDLDYRRCRPDVRVDLDDLNIDKNKLLWFRLLILTRHNSLTATYFPNFETFPRPAAPEVICVPEREHAWMLRQRLPRAQYPSLRSQFADLQGELYPLLDSLSSISYSFTNPSFGGRRSVDTYWCHGTHNATLVAWRLSEVMVLLFGSYSARWWLGQRGTEFNLRANRPDFREDWVRDVVGIIPAPNFEFYTGFVSRKCANTHTRPIWVGFGVDLRSES